MKAWNRLRVVDCKQAEYFKATRARDDKGYGGRVSGKTWQVAQARLSFWHLQLNKLNPQRKTTPAPSKS